MTELSAVNVSISPLEKFQEFLSTKDMRLTQERASIVEEVFSSHEHFDAEELVARMQSRNDRRRVSRSTAYRTLSLLEEANLLRKVTRADGREIWEHDYGYPQHDHMYCQRCGSLIEFTNESLRNLRDEVCREHGFRPVSHRLVIYGTCASCNRSRVSKRRLDMV